LRRLLAPRGPLRRRHGAGFDEAKAHAVGMAQLIEDLAVARVTMLREQRLGRAVRMPGTFCLRARRTVGMLYAVQQAQRLRQQQRADQQADQGSAQRQGNVAVAVHVVAARPGSLTTASPHNPPHPPGWRNW
jgi:hypothetical protein